MKFDHIDRLDRLAGVDHHLSAVIIRAAILYYGLSRGERFIRITEGVRTRERQEKLFAEKKTQTLRSYHLTGRAVDVAVMRRIDRQPIWELGYYRDYADLVDQASSEFGVLITWGGSWSGLRDGPHFQIEHLER